MTHRLITIATRKSLLALWQARYIATMLQQQWPGLQVKLLPLQTSGDKFVKDKLQALGGKGLFVKELEEALLNKKADIAVHSMKDVPIALPPSLTLPTICKRHNPFDAMVSQNFPSLTHLPAGAIVGTSSLRRQFQLLAIRPDLQIKPLRGNIHTRIGKMQAGEFDAIILAAAGLERMGIKQVHIDVLTDSLMLPSCGQGALGIECRDDDNEVKTLLAPLNDEITSQCVQAERLVNAQLGGNCHTPLAVFCALEGQDEAHLQARIASRDGLHCIKHQQRGPLKNVMQLAAECTEDLLKSGAKALIEATKHL